MAADKDVGSHENPSRLIPWEAKHSSILRSKVMQDFRINCRVRDLGLGFKFRCRDVHVCHATAETRILWQEQGSW